MTLSILAAIFCAIMVGCETSTINHDKVKPFPQPEPITIPEKTAQLFKPQLKTPERVCVPFPAVNAAGKITGGLKGTNGNDACDSAPLGSQIYGRAGWYNDLWAMMYAWYFPKGFSWVGFPKRRHDWKSVVVWIDNPRVERPKIVGVSMSYDDSKRYYNDRKRWTRNFVGSRWEGPWYNRTYIYGSNTSLRFDYTLYFGRPWVGYAYEDGEYQDLIMWEELTEEARVALNDNNSFGSVEVPFNDVNFENRLASAWPL